MTRSQHVWIAALVLCAFAMGCGEPEAPTVSSAQPTAPTSTQTVHGSAVTAEASDSATTSPTPIGEVTLATIVATTEQADTTPTRRPQPLDDDAVIAAYVAITCAQKAGRAAQLASLYATHGLSGRLAWQTQWQRASTDAALVRRATEKAAATCP